MRSIGSAALRRPRKGGSMEAISAGQLGAGRILSGIAVAFLLFDAAGKLMKVAPVIEGTVKLGYAESAVFSIGVLLMTRVVLYVIPSYVSACHPTRHVVRQAPSRAAPSWCWRP